MNPDEKCGNCKYFVPTSKDKNAGECHKNAPRPSPRPKMQIEGKDIWAETQWPKVGIDSYCGEFEQK